MSDAGPAMLLATRSLGKLYELRPLFEDAGLRVEDLSHAGLEEQADESDLECYQTFEENALAKARYFHALSGGRATIADDSGLEVQALGGAPGVHSKRWSARPDLSGRALDAANNGKLLAALHGTRERHARYVCVAAYVDDQGECTFRGESTGTILDAPRGSGGFGYDPLFLSDALGVTFGEASREDKERVSHRGRAFAKLVHELRSTPRR
ncbi:MAG TPA: non-canonical purine NTP pyrophosphatase [Gemmatimonadaceae bacterium]|nr:non-canonical purine NTP pyrophosphatase [Gemmatimonadaceae bacterium]